MVGTGIPGANATWVFRLLADGSLDSSYAVASVGEAIFNILCAPNGDKLYYYAWWNSDLHGSVGNAKFGRLISDGTIDSSYDPIVLSAPGYSAVSSFGADPDGSFLLLSANNSIVRYAADGHIDSNFSLNVPVPLNTYVDRLLPLPDGRVLVGGSFTTLNGAPRTYLARYYPSIHDAATRLVNLSVRSTAGTGSATMIVGFVVTGQGGKSVLVRAVGPGLAGMNVPDHLTDPQLTLYGGSNVLLTNNDWSSVADPAAVSTLSARLGAFALVSGSKDAATSTQLPGGLYTMHLSAVDGVRGVGLAEVYDADDAPADFDAPRLVNISARAQAGSGSETLIAGFVLVGKNTKRVLIRAVGPGLTQFNVDGALADPQLTLFSGSTAIASNDNWGGDAMTIQAAATAVGAFALPADSKDSALLVTLTPGAYTTQVSAASGTAGIALVEVYEVP